jgi:ribosomal protein S18 acetylase RimI-like enzyme
MRLFYVNPHNVLDYRNDIWALLVHCNNDFIPALSERDRSSGAWLSPTDVTNLPKEYFASLLENHFIFAEVRNKIVGFTCFKNRFTIDGLDSLGETNYVSTTCVYDAFRGNGVATALYKFLEVDIPDDIKLAWITRRTWSTNLNQIHLFDKLGYSLLLQLDNHRGEGINTVYYGKKLL